MDETDLYYRSSSMKTMSKAPVSGVKVDKTRMTIAFFCNADGSSNISPVIIGYYEKPRCFKKRRASDLGFHYYSDKKAWMYRAHFRQIQQHNEESKQKCCTCP